MSVACTSPSLVSLSRPSTADAAAAAFVRIAPRQLAAGQATSLRADGARLLQVRQGRIWVTRDATARNASEDLVLAPGDSLVVAAGDRIVMESWGAAGAAYTWDSAAA